MPTPVRQRAPQALQPITPSSKPQTLQVAVNVGGDSHFLLLPAERPRRGELGNATRNAVAEFCARHGLGSDDARVLSSYILEMFRDPSATIPALTLRGDAPTTVSAPATPHDSPGSTGAETANRSAKRPTGNVNKGGYRSQNNKIASGTT